MKQASSHAATRTTSRPHMSPVDSEPAAPDNVRPSERPSVPRECALKDTKTARSIWMFGGNQEHRSPDLQPPIDGATQRATWRNIRAAVTILTATRTTRNSVNSRASWQAWIIIIVKYGTLNYLLDQSHFPIPWNEPLAPELTQRCVKPPPVSKAIWVSFPRTGKMSVLWYFF